MSKIKKKLNSCTNTEEKGKAIEENKGAREWGPVGRSYVHVKRSIVELTEKRDASQLVRFRSLIGYLSYVIVRMMETCSTYVFYFHFFHLMVYKIYQLFSFKLSQTFTSIQVSVCSPFHLNLLCLVFVVGFTKTSKDEVFFNVSIYIYIFFFIILIIKVIKWVKFCFFKWVVGFRSQELPYSS